MELKIGDNLVLSKNPTYLMKVINTYENGIIPMSKYDNDPTPCYQIRMYESKSGRMDVDKWFTVKEMEYAGFRKATAAEIILYGSK